MSPFILDEIVFCGYVIRKIPMRRVIDLTGKTAIKSGRSHQDTEHGMVSHG